MVTILVLAALGAGGCARSVNDHLAEARSNAPEAVKDAVVSIGDILYQKEANDIPFDEADREAILYLKDVAEKNPVTINRATALSTLGRLRKAEAGDVFLVGLQDPFWLSRLESTRAMGFRGAEKYAQPLRVLLSKETQPEVRLGIVKALGRIKGDLALQTLLEEFLEHSKKVLDPRLLAYQAIHEITGLDYSFYDDKNWKAYYWSRFGDALEGKATGEQPELPVLDGWSTME